MRLTDECRLHITMGHPEMADYYYEILETVESRILFMKENMVC